MSTTLDLDALRAAVFKIAQDAIYRTAHNGPDYLCGLIADSAVDAVSDLKPSRSTGDLRANIDGTGHVVISAPPKVEGDQGDEKAILTRAGFNRQMDITQALMGPHEWGYRDPVEGSWIEDQTPFAAAELISALRLECAKLRRIMSTPTGDA